MKTPDYTSENEYVVRDAQGLYLNINSANDCIEHTWEQGIHNASPQGGYGRVLNLRKEGYSNRDIIQKVLFYLEESLNYNMSLVADEPWNDCEDICFLPTQTTITILDAEEEK